MKSLSTTERIADVELRVVAYRRLHTTRGYKLRVGFNPQKLMVD